jgi:HD-GYP domain-containing protein (c-di-GMP phosphodiesterase class II)
MLVVFKMRFQNWVLLSTTLLVLIMAAAFLTTVVRTFISIAEDHATSSFAWIAQQASGELENLLRQNVHFVTTQAKADPSQFVRKAAGQPGSLNPDAMVPLFLAALDSDSNSYSHFFALPDEEFLQVIGTHDDPHIVEALKAPSGTFYAVRRITPTADGKRRDHYQFLDKNRIPLGNREQEATLVPTARPWYLLAQKSSGTAFTSPYLFASSGELGITVSAALSEGIGVLATDISLRSLRGFLAGLSLPVNGAIAIQDASGKVLAFHGKGARLAGVSVQPMTPPEKIGHPLLALLRESSVLNDSRITPLGADGEPFVVTREHAVGVKGAEFIVTVWAPLSDFTGAFTRAQRDVILLSVAVLLVLLPLAFVGSRRIARSLETMARDSEQLNILNFSHTPHKPNTILHEINALGEAQITLRSQIQNRTKNLVTAQDKLENLIQVGLDLGRERDRMALLRKILVGGKTLLNCDAGTLYIMTDHKTLHFALRTKSDELPSFEIPLYDAEGKPVERYMATWCALHNEPIIVDDVYSETRFDVSGAKKMDAETGYRSISMLTVPLSPREGKVIGVLQFINALNPETGKVIPFPPEMLRFITAMAAQAAVALDNFQLTEAQMELLDAMIKLIAGAIDAKSVYTGGHCERVPELGIMLAEAACAVEEGPLADFRFTTEDEWREFRIGAWLHDCGKVTTPEYVVDKATKLETIYNRIHEVRMRFEVLLRDARITQLEAIAAGVAPATALATYAARKAQLADDFAFIAECNLGGELMAPEKLERLKRIAEETWARHYDDRLGLSHGELKRYQGEPEALPATEKLLADKPHHVIPRTDLRSVDPKWGFKVKVPEHLYNYGEVYNLGVGRGTLTEEERFKINEHVMQSLMMLEQLPLPKSMRRIPEYAVTHHETLIGTGYPRKLTETELSVPMRIMAIADIFEALTASDRPYKKAKTLSESIKILSFFKKDKHIDPALFDLFLTSGVYQRYAEKYLLPEQIDAVDIAQFVS